jgi:ribosome modulation factor
VSHGEIKGRAYAVRNDGGLFQANELGSDWVSGWAESLEDAVGEIVDHVT